jgi:hypothetical protein
MLFNVKRTKYDRHNSSLAMLDTGYSCWYIRCNGNDYHFVLSLCWVYIAVCGVEVVIKCGADRVVVYLGSI